MVNLGQLNFLIVEMILFFSASSRSGSPSARLSYITHTQQDAQHALNDATTPTRRRSGIPRSQGNYYRYIICGPPS